MVFALARASDPAVPDRLPCCRLHRSSFSAAFSRFGPPSTANKYDAIEGQAVAKLVASNMGLWETRVGAFRALIKR